MPETRVDTRPRTPFSVGLIYVMSALHSDNNKHLWKETKLSLWPLSFHKESQKCSGGSVTVGDPCSLFAQLQGPLSVIGCSNEILMKVKFTMQL